nr:DUF1287 domain-containing protein [Roseibacillus persicicus]
MNSFSSPTICRRRAICSLLYLFLFAGFCQGQDEARTESTAAEKNSAIATAARGQIGVTIRYVPDYVSMEYPNGDVPKETGVCTDVVIRALRKTGQDLQKLVHEDMRANFSHYPKNWGLSRTDRNIDHRRVPNLKTFFKRKGMSLPVTQKAGDYKPGDLVTCTVAGKLPHIMVVSDKKSRSGVPLVIHNIGSGTREEDRLFDFPITGHYRFYRD